MYLFKKINQKGQGLAEYALMLSLVAVVTVAALTNLGTALSRLIGNVAGQI